MTNFKGNEILMDVRRLIIERQQLADKLDAKDRKIDELNQEITELKYELFVN